jgi:protochlorophyllide reductase
MHGERTYVITGATSGMGLLLARRLARSAGTRLLVGARTPALASALQRVVPTSQLTLLELDLANPESVAQFCNRAAELLGRAAAVDAIVCNAGLQIVSNRVMTADGVEMTFAANHLGHFQLVHGLLPMMRRGGLVVATASGTHDPNDRLARRFGFRGGIFPSAEAVARGDLDASKGLTQQGMDRYATSKLCNILFVKDMARRTTDGSVRFLAFDPGLMPGTGLARDRSAMERLGWTYLLPVLRFVMGGVSSAERSADAYAKLLHSAAPDFASGAYVDFRLREIAPSEDAARSDLAHDLYRISARLSQVDLIAYPVAARNAGSAGPATLD